MKIEQYFPKEDLNDYARSDMYDWLIGLWEYSDHSRIIMLNGSDFWTLAHHPCLLQGVGGGWIEVQNTTLFFPFLGLTIMNSDLVENYRDVSVVLMDTRELGVKELNASEITASSPFEEPDPENPDAKRSTQL